MSDIQGMHYPFSSPLSKRTRHRHKTKTKTKHATKHRIGDLSKITREMTNAQNANGGQNRAGCGSRWLPKCRSRLVG